jgi:hypothetical protein
MMQPAASPLRSPADRRQRLILLGRLQEAEADHDRARLGLFAGVTPEALDAEKTRWSRIGGAIAALARMVCETCAISAFCETRPRLEQVTLRLSESIDDQFDREAWRLIDAAARLAVGD